MVWKMIVIRREKMENFEILHQFPERFKKHKNSAIGVVSGKVVIIVDDQKIKEYDDVLIYGDISICKHGERYGIIGAKNNKQVALIDGTESNEYYAIYHIGFSPKCQHYFFKAQKTQEKKYIMVIDGIESNEYRAICDIIFSIDEKNYWFIAQKENGKKVAVINGKETEELDTGRVYKKFVSPGIALYTLIACVNGQEKIIELGHAKYYYPW
jgi:hypothetical protein